ETMAVIVVSAKKHASLPRGVSASNDNDVISLAELCLNECGAVIHAGAFERGEVFERQLGVFCPGRDYNRPCWNTRTVLQFHNIWLPLARKARCFGEQHLRAK